MAYSEEYYANERRIAEYKEKIDELKEKLKDLDEDYKTIHNCKRYLAAGSIILKNISNQCCEIESVFDSSKFVEKYNVYQIKFKDMQRTFDFLDKIVSSTKNYDLACDDVKLAIDTFGSKLDDYCKEVADDAIKINDEISSITSTINTLQSKRIYLMNPKEDNTNKDGCKETASSNKNDSLSVYSLNPEEKK